jgi:hypothetical protein
VSEQYGFQNAQCNSKKNNYISFYATLHDLWRKCDEELLIDDDNDLSKPLPTDGQYI